MAQQFIVRVDLDSFAVSGDPAPVNRDGLLIACAGYVASGTIQPTFPEQRRDAAHELARAYRRWKGALSAHVLGQYSAVIIDPANRSLLCVQDSLGVCPLFYRIEASKVSLANALEQLLSHYALPQLNEEYFADFLASGGRVFAATPWKGVERLSLGHSASIDERGSATIFRPWTPSSDAALPRDEADLDERFRDLLREAIGVAVPATEKVMCELSGGLDSTTVLTFARERRLDACAMTFVSPSTRTLRDDQSYAEAVVAELQTPWRTIDTDACPAFGTMPTEFRGEPGTESLAQKLCAYDDFLTREDIAVVLTGWGGDLVFASIDVEPHHFADGLVTGDWLTTFRAIRRWQREEATRHPWTHWFVNYALRTAWRHRRHKLLTPPESGPLPSWLSSTFVRAYDLKRRSNRQWAPQITRAGTQYLWQIAYSIAAEHGSSGRAHLHAETRHPLFHRPLVEFMFALDERLRRPANHDRVLQRRALTGILPDVVRRRPSKGTSALQQGRSLMANVQWYDMLVNDPRVVEKGFVDPARWRAEAERARFGAAENQPYFECAMNLECWLRNIESLKPPPPRRLQPVAQHAP